MNRRDRNRVCPAELAPSLDNKIRRWLQNPHDILSPFVKEGMKVLDVGCGPGYFSVEMATLVGPRGRVVSADLQEAMLQKLSAKVHGTGLESRIALVQCSTESINVIEKVDFILAFYVVHEVPDKASFFAQLKTVLRDQGQCLLVEPKLFHVSRQDFDRTKELAVTAGFRVTPGPQLKLSWTALLGHR